MSTGDKLTDLLFTLPAELRNTIYCLSLPKVKPHIHINRPYPQLRWLACSQELFADAAAMFYGSACFYHCTNLTTTHGNKKVVQLLDRHISTTYVGLEHDWMLEMAGRLIKEVVLDLRMAYEQVPDLPKRLRWYLKGFSDHFPNLRKLFIFFGPDFMIGDIGTVHVREDFDKLKRKWMDPGDYAEGDQFTTAVAVVDAMCPRNCEIRWRVSGQFNVIDTGAPVKPLRWGSPQRRVS